MIQPQLTAEQRLYIKDYILGQHLPWYHSEYQVSTAQHAHDVDPRIQQTVMELPIWTHVLITRIEKRATATDINSPHWQFFEPIFRDWAKANNEPVKEIFRACLNCVTGTTLAEISPPHVDHPHFEHKNWIMYLNTVDDSSTVIFNEDCTIKEEVPCVEFTVANFGGDLHSVRYPKWAKRFSLVITYI